MPEPRMAYITNRRLFENAFEIAVKNKFQQYCEDLAETKFKNKLPTWWNYVGKQNEEGKK